MQQDGLALKYASDALKNHRAIVLAAVQQCGSALKYASDYLKNDQAFVMAAVNQNAKALNFIGPSLRNPEFFTGLLASIAILENKDQSQEERQSYRNALKQKNRSLL